MADPTIILVVDDQPQVRLPLEFLLKTLPGVVVLTASNGRQAVELAIRHRPMLALLDVMMPVMDGYTAGQKIREGWGDHDGQIWFLTARGSTMDTEQARVAGAQQFINKPFDPDGLLALVRALMASRNSGASAPTGAPLPTHA